MESIPLGNISGQGWGVGVTWRGVEEDKIHYFRLCVAAIMIATSIIHQLLIIVICFLFLTFIMILTLIILIISIKNVTAIGNVTYIIIMPIIIIEPSIINRTSIMIGKSIIISDHRDFQRYHVRDRGGLGSC